MCVAFEYDQFTAFDRVCWPKVCVGCVCLCGGVCMEAAECACARRQPHCHCAPLTSSQPTPLARMQTRYAGIMQYDGDLKLPAHYLVAPPAISLTSGERGLDAPRAHV